MSDKYVVVEYDVQDSLTTVPEVHRWIVRDTDLAEIVEYIENHFHTPDKSFRVLTAGMWDGTNEIGGEK